MLELTLSNNHIKIKKSDTDIKFIPCGMFVISTDQSGENILFSDEMDTYGTTAIKINDITALGNDEGPFTLDIVLNQLVSWNSNGNSSSGNSNNGSNESINFEKYTIILEEGIHTIDNIVKKLLNTNKEELKYKIGDYKIKALKSDVLDDYVPFTIIADKNLYEDSVNINISSSVIEYNGYETPFILEVDVFEKVQVEIDFVITNDGYSYPDIKFDNMVEFHEVTDFSNFLDRHMPSDIFYLGNKKVYFVLDGYNFDYDHNYKKVILSAVSINVQTLGTNIKSVQLLTNVELSTASIYGTNNCVVKGYINLLTNASISSNTNLKLYVKGDCNPDGGNEIINNIDSYFEFLNNGVGITNSDIVGNNHGSIFVLLNKTPNYYDTGTTDNDSYFINNLNKSNTLVLPMSMKTANDGEMAMSVQTAINNGVNVIFL